MIDKVYEKYVEMLFPELSEVSELKKKFSEEDNEEYEEILEMVRETIGYIEDIHKDITELIKKYK